MSLVAWCCALLSALVVGLYSSITRHVIGGRWRWFRTSQTLDAEPNPDLGIWYVSLILLATIGVGIHAPRAVAATPTLPGAIKIGVYVGYVLVPALVVTLAAGPRWLPRPIRWFIATTLVADILFGAIRARLL